MSIKDEVYFLNKKYEENDFNGIYQGINNLKIIKGNVPILLSAPHSVKHVRNGYFKRSDGLTGGITEYLAFHNQVFGITRVHNMLDDPNYYNIGESFLYKNVIMDLIKEDGIKCLLDIHGCSDNHDFSIDIGTNNGKNTNKNIVNIILDKLKVFDKVMVDEMFKASNDGNISKYIHERTGISCIQIEISKNIRFNKTEILIDCLENIIKELQNIEIINQFSKDYAYKKTRKYN